MHLKAAYHKAYSALRWCTTWEGHDWDYWYPKYAKFDENRNGEQELLELPPAAVGAAYQSRLLPWRADLYNYHHNRAERYREKYLTKKQREKEEAERQAYVVIRKRPGYKVIQVPDDGES